MSRTAKLGLALAALVGGIVIYGSTREKAPEEQQSERCRACMREWEQVGKECGPRCQSPEGHNECLETCWEQIKGGDVALPNCGPLCSE